MKIGVPAKHRSCRSDPRAAVRRPLQLGRIGRGTVLALLASLLCLAFAGSALAASASVGLGSAASFSVLAGSTVTNTGPTTLFGSLGLSPGSSVTGAPHVLGQTHIDDAVAIGAKNSLTSAYNDAASRPSNGSAGTDLAGQTFLPGVRVATGALLLSSGAVTLNAQGNPDAVFIFQVGSTLITASNTSVLLVNGAQACNVFWQVGSSATLGTGTAFVGTIMASTTITANTAATIHGRLLAGTGAVNLEDNTITTSNCPSSESGEGGGNEVEVTALTTAPGIVSAPVPTTSVPQAAPGKTSKKAKRTRTHHRKLAHPRPARPHHIGGFTG